MEQQEKSRIMEAAVSELLFPLRGTDQEEATRKTAQKYGLDPKELEDELINTIEAYGTIGN